MVTIKKNLTDLDYYPRKDHGQNFLSNDKLINKIINFIISKKINRVVEIGPGLGAITDKLKQADKKLMLICIEKDKKLFEYLQKKYSNVTNFKIINKDVLKIDLKEYVNNKTLIFGNLPYNIATKILIDYTNSFMGSDIKALFMFQKEVADKIVAKKTKKSQLSTKINCFFHIEEFLNLNQSDFWPQPKIKSTMLHIIPKKLPQVDGNPNDDEAASQVHDHEEVHQYHQAVVPAEDHSAEVYSSVDPGENNESLDQRSDPW